MIEHSEADRRLSVHDTYEAEVLDILVEHAEPIDWAPVTLTSGSHRAVLRVSRDALRVPVLDQRGARAVWRPAVSALVAQRYADHVGAMLLTPRVADAIHASAAVRIEPMTDAGVPTNFAGQMRHSARIEAALASRPTAGIIEGVGKHWVLTNTLRSRSPGTASNYGWYSTSAPYVSASGLRVWQPLSWRHDIHHWDYSQTLRLMSADIEVDGVRLRTDEVAREPELAGLISSEGVLSFIRHPWLPGDAPPAPLAPPPTGALAFLRTLVQGMRGDDVRAWQGFLGAGSDGDFGPHTAALTRQFQAARGLKADAKVGTQTVAAANEEIAARLAPPPTPAPLRSADMVSAFRQAKTYLPRQGRPIDLVVIHTAEIAELVTSAEALMNWAAGPNAPKASWHFAVDSDSVTQSVRIADQAAHAPGVNEVSIGIELCGRAAQTPEQWSDDYSLAVLDRAARLVAALCLEHRIPVEWVDSKGLVAKHRGITTHAAVSLAFRKSTHTDPGPHFPRDRFLEIVRQHAR